MNRIANNQQNCIRVHTKIQRGEYVGSFGGNVAMYYALARTVYAPTEGLICADCTAPGDSVTDDPADIFATKNPVCPEYNSNWPEISTFDPYGMYGERPTISATSASMDIPEIKDSLVVDGTIVNPDKSINCIKIGIEPVWNLPAMSRRLQVDETLLRENIFSIYRDERILTEEIFLPPVGGTTVYLIGQLSNDSLTTSRSHDECNGSDVFGTDICTCRPYLTFSIEEAVKTAQQGGRGIVCYNRKEGRSLGEVVKFLVYNNRSNQEGGDRPETYFDQTTEIAGVPDARMQPLMPDVLQWLGVVRLDNWISMSNDKSDAIRMRGIEIKNQYEIPTELIPKRAHVEIDAKLAAGYFSNN